METAHRLPRFFVLWWTLLPLAAIAVLTGTLSASAILMRNVSSEVATMVFAPIVLALTLAAFGFVLGAGQSFFTGRSIRSESATVTSIVVAAGFMFAMLVGWLLGALIVWGISSLLYETVYESGLLGSPLLRLTQGLVGGVSFGVLYGLVQRQQFIFTARLPWLWVAISAAGWASYGISIAMLSGGASSRAVGIGPTPPFVAVLVGLLIPGLVTGLALKHIVESQPGPTEAVPAGVEA